MAIQVQLDGLPQPRVLSPKNGAGEESNAPIFSSGCLGGVDLIMATSGAVRGAIETANVAQSRDSTICTSALGITTVFSVVGGALAMHKGWKDSSLMRRIGDVTGHVLAGLRFARGTIVTVAGSIFVPVRALTLAAYATASKSMELIAGILGQIGGSLFGFTGVLLGIGTAIDLSDQISFRASFNAALVGDGGIERAFTFLKEKLTLTAEEAALPNEEREALLAKKKSMLTRSIGAACVEKIETATVAEAEEVIAQVSWDNGKKIAASIVMLALSIMGIVSTIIPFISATSAALVAVAAINLLSATGWLIFDLKNGFETILKKASEENDRGKYDHILMGAVSLLCISAVTFAGLFEAALVMQFIALGVGILWLSIVTICLINRYA